MSLFGDLFDFNGDGKDDMFEELLGLELLGFFDDTDENSSDDSDFDD